VTYPNTVVGSIEMHVSALNEFLVYTDIESVTMKLRLHKKPA